MLVFTKENSSGEKFGVKVVVFMKENSSAAKFVVKDVGFYGGK